MAYPGFNGVTFSTPVPVTNGSVYWLAILTDNGGVAGAGVATPDTWYPNGVLGSPDNPYAGSDIGPGPATYAVTVGSASHSFGSTDISAGPILSFGAAQPVTADATLSVDRGSLYVTEIFSDTQFAIAIYSDNAGAPDALLGVSDPITLTFLVPDLSSGGRVRIAFDDGPLTINPTWTIIDDTPNLVSRIEIRRGRQTETEQTETSTATVFLNDRNGDYNPDNVSSPYYGKLDGKQISLSCWDPVALEWVEQYRGLIDEYGYDIHPAYVVTNIQIECVDLFDYLAGVEMIPGTFGDAPPAGSERTVFYDETDFQTRVVQVLEDAFLGDSAYVADRCVVFTGNIDVQATKYDPGDSCILPFRDALDAEFPGIANGYTDKQGRIVAHGRLARFDPDGVAATTTPDRWNFQRWKAGDQEAWIGDNDYAQIRPPLHLARARSRIVNAAMSYPRGIADTAMAGQFAIDVTSRDAYGYLAWSAPDLIVKQGTTTGFDANDECRAYADWKVANYKDPRRIVDTLTVLAIDTSDPRAESTWALLVGQDISDVVHIQMAYAEIDEDFFIEGSEMTITPANPEFDMVTLSINVTPASDYQTDVFTPS